MEDEAYLSEYRWKILAMVYVCQLSFALVFQSIPPLLRLIVFEFGMTYAQAGLFMSLFALPGILVAIPGGMFSDRYGVKRVAIASLLLMVVGSFVVGVGGSFTLTLMGRVVSGIGAVILSIILPQLLSSWFRRRDLGLAIGIFNTGMPLGTVVSFNILGLAGLSLGWRAPILVTTIVTVIALLLFLFLFREADHGVGGGELSSGFSSIGISIWLVGLAWMCFNAAFISFLTFAQDFFVTGGYGVAFASFLTSLVMLISLPLSPLIGYLMGKFGREEAFIGIGGAALASLLFLMPSNVDPVLLLALMGVFNAFVPPPIFSLPSKLVRRQNFGLAFGIISTCLNIGVLVGPYIVGYAKDVTGRYTIGFYLMSLFGILQVFSILLLFFMRTKRAQL